VSLIGWCLHDILLTWCSNKEICVSNRLVPTKIYKDKFLWFSPARISMLNSMYYNLSLHVFNVLKLIKDI